MHVFKKFGIHHVCVIYLSPHVTSRHFFFLLELAVGEVGHSELGESNLALKEKVFAREERQTRFYIRKADSSFSKKNDCKRTCRMFPCKRANFL